MPVSHIQTHFASLLNPEKIASYDQEFDDRPTDTLIHSAARFLHIHEGRGEIQIDGRPYPLCPNQLILILPWSVTTITRVEEPLYYERLIFNLDSVNLFLRTDYNPKNQIFDLWADVRSHPCWILDEERESHIRRIFDSLREELGVESLLEEYQQKRLSDMYVVSLLVQLLVTYNRGIVEESDLQHARISGGDQKPFSIPLLLRYLYSHLSEDITLDKLEKIFYVSKSTITKTVKASLGYNYQELLTSMRITKAIDFLSYTEFKLEDIAKLVGFNNASHLIQTFEREMGVSPTHFRRQVQSDGGKEGIGRRETLSLEEKQTTLPVINYFFQNYQNPKFTPQQVSRQANISMAELNRITLFYAEQTPSEFIYWLRINQAAELLLNTDMKVGDLAMASGFNNLKTFYRYFSQYFSMTPTDFRKQVNYQNRDGSVRMNKKKGVVMIHFDRVMYYFKEISKIPRPSGHEEQISNYLAQWGREQGFDVKQDEKYNVLISRPAARGKEDIPGIILQGHMDMVCVKTEDSPHDFSKDPIELVEKDGILSAKDTSLGADDGVGVAIGMAIMEDREIDLPQLQLLVTTDEETGMSGALALSEDWLEGKRMINVDSEVEGIMTVGSAGGETFFMDRPLETETLSGDYQSYQLNFSGLLGGHSGQNIDEARGNMVKIMFAFFDKLVELCDFHLSDINAGTFDNVIPGSGQALITVKGLDDEGWEKAVQEIKGETADLMGEVKIERKKVDPQLTVWAAALLEDSRKMIHLLPNGVHSVLEKLQVVESSNNIALIRQEEGKVHVEISLRSSNDEKMDELHKEVKAIVDQYHYPYEIGAVNPSWNYVEESALRETAQEVYRNMYGKDIKTVVTHAGLECGCIDQKYPGMDMISIGPDISHVHSVDEIFNLESGKRVFDYIQTLILALSEEK